MGDDLDRVASGPQREQRQAVVRIGDRRAARRPEHDGPRLAKPIRNREVPVTEPQLE
jgi:hypothetical protein